MKVSSNQMQPTASEVPGVKVASLTSPMGHSPQRMYFIDHESVQAISRVADELEDATPLIGRREGLSDSFFLAIQNTRPVDATILSEELHAAGGFMSHAEQEALDPDGAEREWILTEDVVGRLARTSVSLSNAPMTAAYRARCAASLRWCLSAMVPCSRDLSGQAERRSSEQILSQRAARPVG